MEVFRILHIMGVKFGGGLLEIIVVNPDETVAPKDYVLQRDRITESQVVELEGDWPSVPSGIMFERGE